MTERPYIWHESKFGYHKGSDKPWTVTLGRPKNPVDYKSNHVAKTLEDAMKIALKLVPREVP